MTIEIYTSMNDSSPNDKLPQHPSLPIHVSLARVILPDAKLLLHNAMDNEDEECEVVMVSTELA